MNVDNDNMLISIIIPSLNEREWLRATIDSIRRQTGAFEIVLADGGSTDGTPSVLGRNGHLVKSARGRATQMNAGAGVAKGDVFLFLHADTRLPVGGLDAIRGALRNPEYLAGCFDMRFDAENRWTRLYAQLSRIRWKRIIFGDRAFFVRRETFERLHGYADIPLFEDLDFALRVHKDGDWVYLSEQVVTAGRRFHRKGWLRQQVRNVLLWSLFHFGVHPEKLKRFYPDYSNYSARNSNSI